MSTSVIKLGPLTTTFTPPPECSTAFLYYDSVLGVNGYWGESCVSDDVKAAAVTGVYASSCYPEGWAGPFATNYRGHPDQLAVFSPGLHCPRGWTSACSVERQTEDDGPTDTQSAFWSVLDAGETGIGCCPTGYSCATLTDLDYQCVKTLTAGEKVSGSSISGEDCDIKPLTISIEDKFINKDLYAPQLNLIQSSSKGSTTAGAGGNSDGSGVDGDNSGSGSQGLSQGATIAIGVSVPLFVIAIGIAAFFILRRRKKTAPQPQEVMVPNDPSIKPELDGNRTAFSGATYAWGKPEMDSGTSITAVDARSSELQGSGVPPLPPRQYQGGFAAHELRGSDYTPPELSATGQIHEMDSGARRS